MTLDAEGAVVSVSERAGEPDEAAPAPAAAAAWGRGPHEARLGVCVKQLLLVLSLHVPSRQVLDINREQKLLVLARHHMFHRPLR